jgi:hypothetical protein
MDKPIKGVLFSKDLKKRIDYVKVNDVYEFNVLCGEVKVFDDIRKVKYQKINDECIKMNISQFENYLYTEGYIDERLYQQTKHK